MCERPAQNPMQDAGGAPQVVGQIARQLDRARAVLICGHVRADGDCIGSMTAMHELLRARGKEVRVFFRGPVLDCLLGFLPQGTAPDGAFPDDFDADVTLCVDAADPERIVEGFLGKAPGEVVNIDHHRTNPAYGALNWVDSAACAVGEMLCLLVDAFGAKAWAPRIAEALYLAIATDTGGFRFGNTSAAALRAAAMLVERGADPHAVATAVWENRSIESLRIETAVMNGLQLECGGRLAWAVLRQDTLQTNGGEANEPDNLASQLRAVQGVEVAVLIRETSEGRARASFRSRGNIDVSEIAARLGGGGHPAAAGADGPGDFERGSEAILDAARQAMPANA